MTDPAQTKPGGADRHHSGRGGGLAGPGAAWPTLDPVTVAAFALLAAAIGEALGRMPGDAATVALRAPEHSAPPGGPVRQLAAAVARSLAVLTTVVGVIAVTGAAAPSTTAVGLLPLAAAPLTAAPLIGAPLRLALLTWCAVRLLGAGVPPGALVAGFVAGLAVWAALGPRGMGPWGMGRRRLGATLRQTVRDVVSVLAATPIVVPLCVPLLIGLALAPWELWRRCREPLIPEPLIPPLAAGPAAPGSGLSVVYLDGVGKTWRPPTRVARELADELGIAVSGARFVTDVLPYSPLQLPLTERRGSGPAWRWLRRHAFGMLVGRNILQTVVVSDARYQAAFGAALAGAITAALHRAGHRPGDGVALVGYSGGAVVAVAAADVLAAALVSSERGGSDPVVISVGGYLDGRVLPQRAVVHHLASPDDVIERLGRMMFPARWRVVRSSAWNRALAAGRVVVHPVAGSRHIGPQGYLSAASGGPDGGSHLRRTAAVAAALLRGVGPRTG